VVQTGVEWHPVVDELYVPKKTDVYVISPSGQQLSKLSKQGWVQALVFSPAGDWLVTQSLDDMVGLQRKAKNWKKKWSVTNPPGSPPSPYGPPDQFESATAFPDGRRALVLVQRRHSVPYIHFTCLLVEYDFASGRVVAERPLDEKESPQGVRDRLAVLPDGSGIVGFRARSVYIWPTDATKPARKVTVSKKDILDVALHPSGRWFVTVCGSSEVGVWDTATLKLVRTYDWRIGEVKCVGVAPDGSLGAVGSSDGKVAIWDWDV
jgi:WD40 repeat protein